MADMDPREAGRVLRSVLEPLNAALAAIEAADDAESRTAAAQRAHADIAARLDATQRALDSLDSELTSRRVAATARLQDQVTDLEAALALARSDLEAARSMRAEEQRLRAEEARAWEQKAADARKSQQARLAELADELAYARLEQRADLDKLALDRKETETALQHARMELRKLRAQIESVAASITQGAQGEA